MLIEILTLFVVPTFAVFTYQYIRHIINLSNFPHGPFPLPIIGNLHLLSHKPYEDLNKLAKSYGDVFSMSFGMTRLVVVNSAEAAKEGLVTKSNHLPDDLPISTLFHCCQEEMQALRLGIIALCGKH